MTQPGRTNRSERYRYGFNGMEKDDEVKGSGNSYDFGARIYDPRVGRWLSTDPQYFRAAGFSPYNYGLDNPIYFMDSDGEWVKITTTKFYQSKDGEKIKKWYHIFKKTIRIEKHILAGNFKLYAHGKSADQLTTEQLEQGARNIQQELLRHYNKTLKMKGKPDIVLTMEFENDIEVIQSLKGVKMTGRKKDDLIIIVPSVAEYVDNDDAVAASLRYNVMLIEPDDLSGKSNSVPHEFMHQHDGIIDDRLTRKYDEAHLSGGIKSEYSTNPQVNWDNADEIGRKKLQSQPNYEAVLNRIFKEASQQEKDKQTQQ